MEDNKAAPSAPPQGGGASRRPLGVLVVFHLVRISYVFGAFPGPCWTSTGPAGIFFSSFGDFFFTPPVGEGGKRVLGALGIEEKPFWEKEGGKIKIDPEWAPEIRPKHRKSLPNRRQQGGAFGAAPRGRRFAPPPWVLLSSIW